MRYLILLLALIATSASADIGGTACARSQDIVENAKGSAIVTANRTRILDNLYAKTGDTTASPTQAQKCSAVNAWVLRFLRAETGSAAASAQSSTVNAAQNAAEADWD